MRCIIHNQSAVWKMEITESFIEMCWESLGSTLMPAISSDPNTLWPLTGMKKSQTKTVLTTRPVVTKNSPGEVCHWESSLWKRTKEKKWWKWSVCVCACACVCVCVCEGERWIKSRWKYNIWTLKGKDLNPEKNFSSWNHRNIFFSSISKNFINKRVWKYRCQSHNYIKKIFYTLQAS